MIIGVSGGKGGTGKTVFSINLAVALAKIGENVTLIDCDPDCPSVHIVLKTKLGEKKEVFSFVPEFDYKKCMKCGLCISKCESNALFQNKNKTPKLFDKLCTGCKTCIYSCPYNAIKEKSKLIGWTYFGKNLGISIYSGELKPSEPLSEKIVDAVKKRGLGKKGITIIDTAAGAHCNVVKALEGCDFAFLITEPTLLGEHDLKAIKKVAKLLGIKYTVVLNRADITGKTISASMKIPYSRKLLECYVDGVSIVEKYPKHEISQKFLEIATGLLK